MTISAEPTGQWIASGSYSNVLQSEINYLEMDCNQIMSFNSGSKDGTVRIWEVETGRCLQTWDIGEPIQDVAWNPVPELPILAVAA